MLTSDFSRKAHAFPESYFCKKSFFSRKIEVHIESNFHFSVSIDVFNHFNATNIKNTSILGVDNTTTYSYLSVISDPINTDWSLTYR